MYMNYTERLIMAVSVVQVTGKFRSGHNPFNQGCAKNCAAVICSPKRPR